MDTTSYLLGKKSGGGGKATDVQVNGTSITNEGVADIKTKGVYNASTNKIATESDLPFYVLDHTQYTNHTLTLNGMKKGIYMWDDLYRTIAYKYNSTDGTTSDSNIYPYFFIILQDLDSNTPNGAKIMQYGTYSSTAPTLYDRYVTRNSSASTGTSINNMDGMWTTKKYVYADNTQTINGEKTFSVIPNVSNAATVVPSNDADFTTKKYVDGAIATAITTTLGGNY